MSDRFTRLWIRVVCALYREDEGQATAEYAVVLGIIVVGIFTALTATGTNIPGAIVGKITSALSKITF
jgi:Flp pilus assembly pilin Flp